MSLDYRTWGATRTCKGCRYWSEMIAMSIGGGGMQAVCLGPVSPPRGQYRFGQESCAAWEEGSLGAIDDPGGNPYLENEE